MGRGGYSVPLVLLVARDTCDLTSSARLTLLLALERALGGDYQDGNQ